LEAVSKIISGIIENNLLEKELNEKNTEILNNTMEKLDLENALKEANIKLMKSRLTSSSRNSISLGSFFTKKNAEYPIALEEELAAAIKKLDMGAVKNVVKKLMDNFYQRELPVNTAKDMLGEMLVSLSRIIYKESGGEDTFLSLRFKYKTKLEGCYDFKAFEQLLLELAEELTEILRNMLLKGSQSLIHKVNLYIQNNYNQDITLNSMAEIFYISPNYLSTLFNEKNGMNLKDYINKLRIEKSKEYLHDTNMKITEISRKVGFGQISYFGSVFKKLEHCTPKQWRARLS
jgi:YesN/AraC family two-component response regulator